MNFAYKKQYKISDYGISASRIAWRARIHTTETYKI